MKLSSVSPPHELETEDKVPHHIFEAWEIPFPESEYVIFKLWRAALWFFWKRDVLIVFVSFFCCFFERFRLYYEITRCTCTVKTALVQIGIFIDQSAQTWHSIM